MKQKLSEMTDFIKSRIKDPPYIGLLTGTGLGESAESMAIETAIRYQDIPHFPVSTVQTHIGRMLSGNMNGCPVIAMQGRDIMLIADHINLTGTNPLIGPNVDSWGIRFPDMTRAYDDALIAEAGRIAEAAGASLQKGIYAGLTGPSLETPSEVKFLQAIGAEAVGFSTVHEVIVAVHGGLRVLGLSTITNVHNPDDPVPATVEEIIAVAKGATPLLEIIIKGITEKIYETELR
ncbi:MAG: purine-nucleoside phosphorylase [Desulfobacterales bacterium]